jgi:hypothetical protein
MKRVFVAMQEAAVGPERRQSMSAGISAIGGLPDSLRSL